MKKNILRQGSFYEIEYPSILFENTTELLLTTALRMNKREQ